MYGTVALCHVRPEDVDALRALTTRDAMHAVDGFLGTDVLMSDNHENTLVMVVRFRDRDAYVANAESPDQAARYAEYRALMEDDPVWYDGEWIAT
jgi:quinol monooxygenase YgiN